MIETMEMETDVTEEQKNRIRANVTAPFWTPNPAADSGIATSTTKKNRDLPGQSILCIADQLIGILIT